MADIKIEEGVEAYGKPGHFTPKTLSAGKTKDDAFIHIYGRTVKCDNSPIWLSGKSEAIANLLKEALEVISPGPLSHEGESDYGMNGEDCWILVQNISVYIRHKVGGVSIEAYRRGEENADCLGSIYIAY